MAFFIDEVNLANIVSVILPIGWVHVVPGSFKVSKFMEMPYAYEFQAADDVTTNPATPGGTIYGELDHLVAVKTVP
jgi:hypothetical protein